MCGAHPKYGSHWRQHHLTRGRGARRGARGAGRGVASSSWGGDGGDNSSWDRGGGDFLPFVRLKGTWSEGIGCSAFADVSFHVLGKKERKRKTKKKKKKSEDKRKKKNDKNKSGCYFVLWFSSSSLRQRNTGKCTG